MKIKRIVLQQIADDDEMYIVDKLVNCIEPVVGTLLRHDVVVQLLRSTRAEVTIKRARRQA